MTAIIGWAHSKFGKLENSDLEGMMALAARQAVEDAGIGFEDVDAIYVGNFGGFEKQGFTASFALSADPALRFKRATRVENACATGSAALHMGMNEIATGKSRFVLVIGAEHMTLAPGAEVGDILLNAAYRKEEGDTPGGFAGIFGRIAQGLFPALWRPVRGDGAHRRQEPPQRRREPLRAAAQGPGLRVLQHRVGQEPLCRRPHPAHRLLARLRRRGGRGAHRHRHALRRPKAINIRAAAHAQDYLPMSKRDIVAFEGCENAWGKAHEMAGTTLDDLSLVETHDCFTIAELIEYEAMGLAPKGEGARAIAEGWTEKDGKLPVNPSGRPQVQGPPDRRHRRVDAHHGLAAADGRGRRHADRGREARRRVQHGRRGGRQLRVDPGTAALDDEDGGRAGPLSGVKVMEFGQIAAGPFTGSLLADLGADVVKVERPDGGDGMRSWPPLTGSGGAEYSENFASLNRNKRSITADLKDAAEVERLRKLAAVADVVVENFRPGVLARLGLGYETLSADNPKLVYCSISGYGRTGPMAARGPSTSLCRR
jgi:acetyl-CoA C-acetyltransferase